MPPVPCLPFPPLPYLSCPFPPFPPLCYSYRCKEKRRRRDGAGGKVVTWWRNWNEEEEEGTWKRWRAGNRKLLGTRGICLLHCFSLLVGNGMPMEQIRILCVYTRLISWSLSQRNTGRFCFQTSLGIAGWQGGSLFLWRMARLEKAFYRYLRCIASL